MIRVKIITAEEKFHRTVLELPQVPHRGDYISLRTANTVDEEGRDIEELTMFTVDSVTYNYSGHSGTRQFFSGVEMVLIKV